MNSVYMINEQTEKSYTKSTKMESIIEISAAPERGENYYIDISEWKTRLKLQMVRTKKKCHAVTGVVVLFNRLQ